MSQFQNDSIFWIETGKIRPNPFQPRTEFDEVKLKDLSSSIRQYGILQPLVVTRHEDEHQDGIATYYELIAGERRLRAAKLAGLSQVPVIIRTKEEENQVRLELAIIENLQREDLNAIDRARAFDRLAKEFKLANTEIAEKVGKSREYVSNSIRLLALPEEMQMAVMTGSIYEGHARALLMLADRPEEQKALFRDVLVRKLSVRDVEKLAREIAVERARKREVPQEVLELERAFAQSLGTKVEIKQAERGGKLIIDFFSREDLEGILAHLSGSAMSESGMSAPRPHDPLAVPDASTRFTEDTASDTADDGFSLEHFSI